MVYETKFVISGSTVDAFVVNSADTAIVSYTCYPAADNTISIDVSAGPNCNFSYRYFYINGLRLSYSEGAAIEDNQAPETPTGLGADNVTENSFTLSWNASSDNVGVTVYNIYKDGTLYVSETSTTTSVTGLDESTTYSMTVTAVDAAGNESAVSESLNVTTGTVSTNTTEVYIDPTYTGGDSDGSFSKPYTSWSSVTFADNTSYLQKKGTTASVGDQIIDLSQKKHRNCCLWFRR